MTRSDAQKVFNSAYESDKKLSSLNNKLASGKGTLADAQQFASGIGDLVSNVLKQYVDMSGMELEELEEIATSVIRPVLKQAQTYVSQYSQGVETLNNSRAGISMQGIAVSTNDSMINNMIQRIIETPSESSFLLEKPAIRNQMGDVVRRSIDTNAQVRTEAGLVVKISRATRTGEKCCDWCEDLSGVYEYGKQPDDFFKCHRNCICVWSTFVEKKNKRIIQKEQWFETDDEGNLTRKRTGE